MLLAVLRPVRALRGPARVARSLTRRFSSETWTVERTRRTFTDYFETKRAHSFVKSAAVVPLSDPTLLFANAGMNQFKPIFLGQVEPGTALEGLTRATNSQKCIRAGGKHNDLEDVGLDTYHHTFFEMMGSWSFGDYFKAEAIQWATELMCEVYGLDKERLYATYFEGDDGLEPDLEAKQLWLDAGFAPERVIPGNKADNFWEMGDSGPCGPCTELHYDCIGGRDAAALVNMDDASVIEIWNLVFIQFNRDGRTGELSSLPAKHVDTGLGLERLVAILNEKPSNYDTDAFQFLFEATHQLLPAGSAKYGGKLGEEDIGLRDTAYRAVADHVRCLSFAIADGAVVSNEGRGYVLRRILRRAVRYGVQTLGASPGFFSKLAPALAASPYGEAYPELRSELARVVAVLEEEEATFETTLERGLKYLDDEITQLSSTEKLSGASAFFLYDSLGFPVDLTELVAREKGFAVDLPGFEAEMETQVQRSREDRKQKAADALGSATISLGAAETAALLSSGMQPTLSSAVGDVVSDDALSGTGAVQALFVVDESDALKRVEAHTFGGPVGIVLDRSPFYAEAGGQAADAGSITIDGVELVVRDVQAFAGYVLHTCVAEEGSVATAATASAEVDAERRRKNSINHSMTHALNWALWTKLGDGVAQRGSDNDADRLRFDFSHGKGLSPSELEEVEALVNGVIEQDDPVQRALVPLSEAMEIPALRAVFGENYPDPVRVVAVGLGGATIDDVRADPANNKWRGASIELCGGTHTPSVGDAKRFVITREEAVAKGVRRVEAVTNGRAAEASRVGDELLKACQALEQADAPTADEQKDLRARIDGATCSASLKPKLRAALEAVAKKLAARDKAAGAAAAGAAAELVVKKCDEAAVAGKTAVVVEVPAGVDGKAVGKLAKKIHKAHPGLALFIVAGDGKVGAFAAVPEGHALGPAGAWLNAALEPLGGRGGGKPAFAQGSAKGDASAVVAAAAAFEGVN